MSVIICYATCWACKFGQCYEPPQAHIWADSEEIEAAQEAGQPAPEGLCACPCAKEEGENDGTG